MCEVDALYISLTAAAAILSKDEVADFYLIRSAGLGSASSDKVTMATSEWEYLLNYIIITYNNNS